MRVPSHDRETEDTSCPATGKTSVKGACSRSPRKLRRWRPRSGRRVGLTILAQGFTCVPVAAHSTTLGRRSLPETQHLPSCFPQRLGEGASFALNTSPQPQHTFGRAARLHRQTRMDQRRVVPVQGWGTLFTSCLPPSARRFSVRVFRLHRGWPISRNASGTSCSQLLARRRK